MKMNGWRGMLTAMAVVALGVVAFSCDDDDDNSPRQQANYTISGNAAGSQVVPAVSGTGSGTITGTYNPNTRKLTYTNTWDGLSGAPTGGGFYNGASGASGTAVTGTGGTWTYADGTTATGSYDGTMMLTEAQGEQLTSGNWYYGYNTAANTTGEVRGQITATQMTP